MLSFGASIRRHSFTFRCLPQSNMRQDILSMECGILPDVRRFYGTDGFGNAVVEGTYMEEHGMFSVSVSGTASVPGEPPEIPLPECAAGPSDAMVYRYHSGKTAPGPAINGFLRSAPSCDCSPLEKAVGLMHRLHSSFSYRKGVTDASTTAEQALAGGAGVCQDYAHILISLLRCQGIPARYVVGLSSGEGESHAWVEVLQDDVWYGLDPTGDCAVGPGHIKMSHGRDYDDCRINRGVFFGGSVASQQVQASVTPVNDPEVEP